MNILKTMFALGIYAGLAAVSAKACDGPVVVPGYTAGSCNCDNQTSSCQPSGLVIGYRRTYTTCGGDGYDSCSSISLNVGSVNPGCVRTMDTKILKLLQEAYDDCLIDQGRNHPYPIECNPPKFCDWNSCAMATSGGTPIMGAVMVSLGDACGG